MLSCDIVALQILMVFVSLSENNSFSFHSRGHLELDHSYLAYVQISRCFNNLLPLPSLGDRRVSGKTSRRCLGKKGSPTVSLRTAASQPKLRNKPSALAGPCHFLSLPEAGKMCLSPSQRLISIAEFHSHGRRKQPTPVHCLTPHLNHGACTCNL